MLTTEEGEYVGSPYRGSELCIADMGGLYTYITTMYRGYGWSVYL